MEHIRSAHTHLASILIGKVLHLRHIHQFHSIAGHGWSHMVGHMISLNGKGNGPRALRLAISLENQAAQSTAHEGQDISGQWGGAHDH